MKLGSVIFIIVGCVAFISLIWFKSGDWSSSEESVKILKEFVDRCNTPDAMLTSVCKQYERKYL
jgi:hypothetical protein